MFRTTFLAVWASALLVQPVAAAASSQSFNLRLVVPELCKLRHVSTSSGMRSGNAYFLGTFREYCNSPRGYTVEVNYSAGSLQGAVLMAGTDTIVLDGSGRATLSRSLGPRVRSREISIVPGANGFDTSRIEFDIVPG